MKREFLQLAHEWDGHKDVSGWFASEKLDGQRCFWDGGFTRGKNVVEIPFANVEKNKRYKNPIIATGLWSRYGNVIHAPDWFLNNLPSIPLDGELHSGEMSRQEIRSITSKLIPDDESWEDLEYRIYNSPPLSRVLANGEISTTNFKVRLFGCYDWAVICGANSLNGNTMFMDMLRHLDSRGYQLHPQTQLPDNRDSAVRVVHKMLDEITARSGEGLILVNPFATYQTGRSHDMLKVKRLSDAEGTVTGYTTGRRTDKGSKLLGLMGALVVDYEGKRLELSGFTDVERVLAGTHEDSYATTWAASYPGAVCPEWISNPKFPRGSIITFQYRGKSLDGIPQEARYWRKWEVE